MPTFREDPAAYMRARRARQKAEREAVELATVRAKVAAIGPGAVITKTAGRFDAVARETFEARQSAAPAVRITASSPKPASGAHKSASDAPKPVSAGSGRAALRSASAEEHVRHRREARNGSRSARL
jgi:hypothetical protein